MRKKISIFLMCFLLPLICFLFFQKYSKQFLAESLNQPIQADGKIWEEYRKKQIEEYKKTPYLNFYRIDDLNEEGDISMCFLRIYLKKNFLGTIRGIIRMNSNTFGEKYFFSEKICNPLKQEQIKKYYVEYDGLKSKELSGLLNNSFNSVFELKGVWARNKISFYSNEVHFDQGAKIVRFRFQGTYDGSLVKGKLIQETKVLYKKKMRRFCLEYRFESKFNNLR